MQGMVLNHPVNLCASVGCLSSGIASIEEHLACGRQLGLKNLNKDAACELSSRH